MRAKLLVLLLGLALGFVLGFAAGKQKTAPSRSQLALAGEVVDCYDKDGNLLPDEWNKIGQARLSCAPGETAKLRRVK